MDAAAQPTRPGQSPQAPPGVSVGHLAELKQDLDKARLELQTLKDQLAARQQELDGVDKQMICLRAAATRTEGGAAPADTAPSPVTGASQP